VLANRVLKILKTFFAWATENDYIPASPVATVKKPTRETPRQRARTHDEIRAFWLATERLKWPWPEINRLLLLTAMRRDEIGAPARAEYRSGDQVIEPAGERSKNALPIVQPLCKPAVQIVEDAPQIGKSGLFFPSKADAPLTQFSKAKSALDRETLVELRKIAAERGQDPDAVELAPWKQHDLRRTVRTELSRIGVPPDIGEHVLGHVIGGVRGVYDKYEFLGEKRAALEKWAAELDRIVKPPKKGEKVAKLRR
jgi:integrase